jgi:hypothetical protein
MTARGAATAVALFVAIASGAWAIDAEPYREAVEDVEIEVGRGIVLGNDELEPARTESVAVNLWLSPESWRLSVPFTRYSVGTRAKQDGVLPLGDLDVSTVGAALALHLGSRRAPFIGVGATFYSFEEMFAAPANVQNTFGGEAFAGFRVGLLDNIFDLGRLEGVVTYRFTVLEPGVNAADHRDVDTVTLNRHGVTLALVLGAL